MLSLRGVGCKVRSTEQSRAAENCEDGKELLRLKQ